MYTFTRCGRTPWLLHSRLKAMVGIGSFVSNTGTLLAWISEALRAFSGWIWGMPLLILVIGGGLFLLVHSGFIPFFHLGHALGILRGKHDRADDPGALNHYQALSSALASTVGMGNIAGVAVALGAGGPGAIFWMWVSALVGMATKFFTCTLAVMYRSQGEGDETVGGPMYYITGGLGKRWKPLAVFFALAGLIATIPAFQTNQLVQIVVDVFSLGGPDVLHTKLALGIALATLVGSVIFGGIKRIGTVASRLVPYMVALYFVIIATVLILKHQDIPAVFALILRDAFSLRPLVGGALGAVIITGVRRAAFSNEAGMGTAPMIHGRAKTREPIREGLVAMLGPFIDTLIVCTLTALAILSTRVWKTGSENGISLTLKAFNTVLPHPLGSLFLILAVSIFALSTLFSYSVYGVSCLTYLSNSKTAAYYNYFYVASIIFSAVIKLDTAVNLIDSAFALMSIPTLTGALILAPEVKREMKRYFKSRRDGKALGPKTS